MSISTNNMYPQTSVRNAFGDSMPVAKIMTQQADKAKKLLIVLQYWEGDRARVEQQAHLIADLERVPNKNADIMLFARYDAGAFSSSALQRLQSKFGVVHQVRCRRRASGYPYGANEMFYDMMDIVANNQKFTDRYYAFLNLESDCSPTRPGWIEELSRAYKMAEMDGKLMIGHWNKTPVEHMNGVGIYAIDIQRRLGAMQMVGGPANAAYDIYLAPRILPVAADTPLIALDFQRPTISADDLFAPRKDGVAPALFHGVKDESAFVSVRNKFITLDGGDLTHKTVFTYFDAVPEIDANEQKAQIELWKEAWKSRGWNPIVLTWLEARKHHLYESFENAVKLFPTVNPKKYELSCFLRWLALDQAGGGLMSDYDCIPGRMMPRDLDEIRKESGVAHILQCNDQGTAVPACVYADRPALSKMIKHLMGYKPNAGDIEHGAAHVSDQSILTAAVKDGAKFLKTHKMVLGVGEADYKTAHAIHFANSACAKFSPGASKSRLMLEYLRSS